MPLENPHHEAEFHSPNIEPSDRTILSRPMLLLLAVVILGGATALTLGREVAESRVYRLASERFLAGETFYRVEHKAFTYPPFAVLPYTTLVPLDPQLERWTWSAANITLLIGSVWLVNAMVFPVVRRGSAKRGAPHWLSVVLILLLAGRFLASPLEYESNDLVILALVTAFCYFQAYGQPWLSAAAGGLAAAFKATPLLLLPLLLWQRRFAAAGLFTGVLLAATLLPDLLAPNPEGGLWVGSWYSKFVSKVDVGEVPEVSGAWIAWNPHNQSLVGSMYRWFTPIESDGWRINIAPISLDESTIELLTWPLLGLVLAGILWCSRPSLGRGLAPHELPFFHLGQTAAAACGMLLLSPMSSTQHFCVLLLPIAFCVTHVLYRRASRPLIGSLAVLTLLGPLAAQDIIGSTIADRLAACGGTTLATLVCLAATGRILLFEMGSPAAAQADHAAPIPPAYIGAKAAA